MVDVPQQYQSLIKEMSQKTGIPESVIAVQADVESGFKSTAVSPAGAQGWLQFLPSTYDSNAAAAGVRPGTEFNPRDESKVYSVYMSDLLRQEKGNLRNALAAYNAGPGNLSAGYGYADEILAKAGGNPGKIRTVSIPGDVGQAVGGAVGGALGLGSISISGVLGNALGDLRDVFERFGLILLGGVLILLGIHILAGGSGGNVTNMYQGEPSKKSGSVPKKGAVKTGATEAAEAAAIA